MYSVLVSRTLQKQFSSLPKELQPRIRQALQFLGENPFQPRPGMDLKPLKGTKPLKHRLRVGEHRIIYRVEEKTVKVIEVFTKGRGYRPIP